MRSGFFSSAASSPQAADVSPGARVLTLCEKGDAEELRKLLDSLPFEHLRDALFVHSQKACVVSPIQFSPLSRKLSGNEQLRVPTPTSLQLQSAAGVEKYPAIAAARSPACLRLLVEFGGRAAVAARAKYPTPLHSAAASRSDDVECIEILLRAGASHCKYQLREVNIPSTAVATTARRNQSLTSTGYLSYPAGANPNAGAGCGMGTPLHSAVLVGATKCVRALLAAGASPAATCGEGRSPVHLAASRGLHGPLAALLDCPGAPRSVPWGAKSETPLILAAAGRHPRTIATLLDRGSSVWEFNNKGLTALQVACFQGALPAPPAGASAADTKALHAQLTELRRLCIEELLVRGASPEVAPVERQGDTLSLAWRKPLGIAAMMRDATSCVALMAAGCEMPDPELDNTTPLLGFLMGLEKAAAGTVGRVAATLRRGPAGAAAALRKRLRASAAAAACGGCAQNGGGSDPLLELRLLRTGAPGRPGEAWWDEDEAARPPRSAALPLDRLAHALVLRETAERAATEAARRSLLALQHWQQCRQAATGGGGAAGAGQRHLDKATLAAALCIRKWGKLLGAAEAARGSEAAQAAAVAGAVQRAEDCAEALGQWAAQGAACLEKDSEHALFAKIAAKYEMRVGDDNISAEAAALSDAILQGQRPPECPQQ